MWMDLRDARDKKDKGLLLPAYLCIGCRTLLPIGAKFHPDQAIARAARPSMKFDSPATRLRNFDEVVETKIGEKDKSAQVERGCQNQVERDVLGLRRPK